MATDTAAREGLIDALRDLGVAQAERNAFEMRLGAADGRISELVADNARLRRRAAEAAQDSTAARGELAVALAQLSSAMEEGRQKGAADAAAEASQLTQATMKKVRDLAAARRENAKLKATIDRLTASLDEASTARQRGWRRELARS
ncbi:hypothetical protein FNF31_05745 [Cafeteria roenbergensis]|uniref:Uncharacterized protein n=1 Tax=Cafeteria roenbergensis TaxID=33653 RepID=A0A5A8CXI5_CAFRO|nr:hypothetical protein FNF31_05745 [Cafeteria roenbergensis]